MGHPAYYGQPALVAPYRRRRHAPPSVHLVALLQYLGALGTLLLSGLVALISARATRNLPMDRVPESVRRGLEGGGFVIAVALAVVGLLWFLIAVKLQRGRGWARGTVIVLSLLSLAGTALDVWQAADPRVLAGAALPVIYVLLLNTRAARSWFRYHTW
jgi:hypothetical protein